MAAQSLVDNGADCNAVNPVKLQTPLHYACIGCSLDVVKVLLSAPEIVLSVNKQTRVTGVTVLLAQLPP